MEIEAKFGVSSEDTFQRLLKADSVGGYALGAERVLQVRDSYLDTTDRRALAAGYSCRRRVQPDGVLMTLKGLRRSDGAIHRREEHEVLLPDYSPPSEWPATPARDKVLEVVGTASLGELFSLSQTRHVRPVFRGETRVAELSLDHVHLAIGAREQSYFELEVELAADGSESDLLTIVACMRTEWGLQAEARSKFEKALVFAGDAAPLGGRFLTAEERVTCTHLSARTDLHGRRAAALLSLDDGESQVAAGQAAGMSERRVRHWLATFRQKRLGVFPERVLAAALAASKDGDDDRVLLSEVRRSARQAPQPWPLDLLMDRYDVDRTHAQAVAASAVALFDQLAPTHNLPAGRRALLETAALVHDIGLKSDPSRHHVAGHEILLQHPPAGLGDQDRNVVAFVSLLHSRKMPAARALKLAASRLAAAPTHVQSDALALAALLRMADGLDYSQGNSRITHLEHKTNRISAEVAGPFAAVDAKRAQTKSDLWTSLFGIRVSFQPAGPSHPAPEEVPASDESISVDRSAAAVAPPEVAPAEQPSQAGLVADDSMAEAARKTFLFHFQRMLAREAGTRLGEDPEELHDMRVATRRMRAAIPVFQDHLDMDQMGPFVKGMRRTGRVLGAVRDLDVFFEKTSHYLDTLPEERRPELDPLLEVWRAQRTRARETMLRYLDSERYARFVRQFGDLLATPAGSPPSSSQQSEPAPYRLRHVVPTALYRRFAEVSAYDEWMAEPEVPLARYHQLRIASKGLRYTLEYFREILGREASKLVDAVKGLQDLLGDINDSVVACTLLRDYLTWGTWGQPSGRAGQSASMIVSPGAAAYLAYRQSELQALIHKFPDVWRRICGPDFRRGMADAVAKL
jgi:CHAD domain-containing protein